ncbi:helix-turn-helix domain-containing protein [Enterococcus sp. CSURQ0835]|uniref:helix-turn-helix domain-containing protein n=1 Tax=Enterococcus sp. CSURQ0835 TaxID=2681394 RepID=UPI001356E3CB|nr:helix-turn-helix domain-containing protein [Enterococcus sp. CSURQ0835]
MNIADLLGKEEHYEYVLAQLISLKGTYAFNYNNLKSMAGLTDFTLNKYLDNLNATWQELFKEELIEVSNRKIVAVKTIKSRDLNRFKRYMITQSFGFKMLEALLYDEFSIASFAEEHYLSQSKIYDVRKNVAYLIEPYGVQIKKDRLVGDEHTIRNLSLEFYHTALNGGELVLAKDLASRVNSIVNVIITNYSLQLSPSQLRKLRLFVAVNSIRNMKGNALAFTLELTYTPLDESLATLLKHHLLLSDALYHQEINYLLAFLYANNFILELNLQSAHSANLIQQLTEEFGTMMTTELHIDSQRFQNIERALNEIQQIHTRLVLFQVASSTFISDEQFRFFEEIYCSYHVAILNHIQQNETLLQLLPSESERIKLYYDYMFILIKYFPIKILEEPIHICVDFSHGDSYTHYIMEEIRRFKDINLEIEPRISNKTELYVSDYEYPKFPKEQIIWKNPPDSTDWQYFGDVIVQLRRRKNEGTSNP